VQINNIPATNKDDDTHATVTGDNEELTEVNRSTAKKVNYINNLFKKELS